jgi:hypothetical protein
MERVDTLFDEFAARWARGERPDAAEYLDRAGKERQELALLLDRYLALAPAQEPDEQTVRFAELVEQGEPPLLAARVARGLRREEVVRWLLKRFEIPPEKEGKVGRYWHELERGARTPADVTPELWTRVVEILGASAETARRWRAPVPAKPTVAFLRAAPDEPRRAAVRAEGEASEGLDEVDRLFGYRR